MKTMMGCLCLAISAMAFSSCSTIYYHNGATGEALLETEEWHHDGILSLVEFSDPVEMTQRCEGKEWGTIKVQQTFIQGFIRGLTASLYDPWNVSYACR